MARNSLKYDLNSHALQGAKLSDQTIRNYKQYNEHFKDYCMSQGYNTFDKVKKGGVGLLNSYVSYLDAEGKSASTIHAYLSAPCKALGIHMQYIDKPKRIIAEGTKSTGHNTDRSALECQSKRYKAGFDFVRAVGCREAEAVRMTGACLTRDDAGNMCVSIIGGKGGKDTLQVILPQYQEQVKSAFEGVGAGERLFRSSGFSKNINYHGARAELAREAYDYYSKVLTTPEARTAMIKQLYARYDEAMTELLDAEKIDFDQYCRKLDRFGKAIQDESVYKLRGANFRSAMEHGRPVEYDRLSLFAVSVLHLSHWRLDVTVTSYMLK